MNILVIGNYYVNYQNVMLLTYSDTKQALSCLQIPPRENWFQYVRRLYATAINFHCIITLPGVMQGPKQNVRPFGPAVFTFIGYKPTNKQIDKQSIDIFNWTFYMVDILYGGHF